MGFTVVIKHGESLTWKRGDDDRVKPSDPGCLTKGKAPGVSKARLASNWTFPKVTAWVSG